MSRIPLTPGDKERISANVGRMLAATIAYSGAVSKDRVALALDLALAIEEAVTEALCPTDIEGD